MRKTLERFLRSADVPNPERAEELWAEYRTGGPGANKAFATLLAWYGNGVYRRIWGFVRSDAAEDVFQDLLARLHKRREKLATFEHALRWMRVVAVAFSLNALRADKRQRARNERAARSETESPGESAAELQEMIRAGLAKLPEAEREAVALHYFEGLTKRDAAAVLGIDRDTLAKRLTEALAKLRQLVPAPAVAAAGGVAGLEARLAATPPLSPARMAALIAAVGPVAVAGWLASTKAKVVAAVLVVGVVSAVSGYVLSRSPEMPPKSPQSVRLGVEPLEARAVPAAGFLSALSIGNPTAGCAAVDVLTDAAGNSFLIGNFKGTTDIDPARTHPGDIDILESRSGPDSPESLDMFVAKYAPDGALLWARRMGGDGVDIAYKLAVDGAGNVYVAGEFRQTATFGSVVRTSAGNADAFVAKLDSAGNVLWANAWGGSLREQGWAVDVDASGNVYALGTRNELTYTTQESANNGYEIRRFAADGSEVWNKWVGTRKDPISGDLVADAAGNVFVAGNFKGTVDFDPGNKTKNVNSGTSHAGFVLKLTSAGNFGWVTPFVTSGGAASNSNATDLVLDGSGNVIVSGTYVGAVDFNPGAATAKLPTAGGVYFAKLNSNGGLNWVRGVTRDASLGDRGVIYTGNLALDAAGNIYASGTFAGTVDFDPNSGVRNFISTGGTNSDAFVLKLTSGGNFVWAEQFGNEQPNQGKGLALDPAGNVYLTGSYKGTIDIDPDPTGTHYLTAPGADWNSFVVKLSQN